MRWARCVLGLVCTFAEVAAGPALWTNPASVEGLRDDAAVTAESSSRRLEREGDRFAGGKHVPAMISDETILARAARTGGTPLCRSLIAEGAEVNQRNAFGTTPLHLAAANGHLGCLELLLAAGAQANALESDGSTPLLVASREGQAAAVGALLAFKGVRIGKVNFPPANPNKADLFGSAPLHVAASRGKVDVVGLLLGGGADVDQRTQNRLETPLFVAARANQAHACTRLVHGGADAALGNREGWTPLHVASHEGHVDTMSALITLGSALDAKATDGATPLHAAAANGMLAAVEKLVRVTQPGAGDRGARRADLNARDGLGRTPLAVVAATAETELGAYGGFVEGGVRPDPNRKNIVGDRLSVLAFLLELHADGDAQLAGQPAGRAVDARAQTLKGESPLFLAAREGHAKALALLLADPRASLDLNVTNHRLETPVFAASASGMVSTLKMLIGRGAALDLLNRDKESALFAAATNEQPGAIVLLAAAGADLDLPDEKGQTPLYAASRRNHPLSAAALVKAGCRLNDANYADGETALFVAAKSGHAACCAVLVAASTSGVAALRCDLERPDRFGVTPLFAAARAGRRDAAQVLVDAGAKEFKASTPRGKELASLLAALGVRSTGNGPFGDAEKAGWATPPHLRPSKVDPSRQTTRGRSLLVADNKLLAGETPLHRAARTGTLLVLKKLLDGLDPADLASPAAACCVDPATGASALHVAAAHGQAGAARLLLGRGAPVNAVDLRGDTPLHVACRLGDAGVASVLAGWRGAALDQLNDAGSSALHNAATAGHVAVIELLAAAGCDLNARTEQRGETALWVAARGNQAPAAAALCALGADKDLADREGWAPLHVAVAKESLACVALLVDQRANADALARDGATPLVLAARLGHAPEAAKLVLGTVRLLRVAADLNLPDARGRTPLIAASAAGHLSVVEVLVGAGCRLDERTAPEGETALYLAAKGGHLSVVARLASMTTGHRKCDLDLATAQGEPPILAAARGGFKEICQVLVDAGAKEFKNASPTGARGVQELPGLLASLGVASSGNGPFGEKATTPRTHGNQQKEAPLPEPPKPPAPRPRPWRPPAVALTAADLAAELAAAEAAARSKTTAA